MRWVVNQKGNIFFIRDTYGQIKHKITFNNKYDAEKHCEYLNKTNNQLELATKEKMDYIKCLKSIDMICQDIQKQSFKVGVIQCAVRIKQMIRMVMMQ